MYTHLCALLPEYDHITVVLVGPRMKDSQVRFQPLFSSLLPPFEMSWVLDSFPHSFSSLFFLSLFLVGLC